MSTTAPAVVSCSSQTAGGVLTTTVVSLLTTIVSRVQCLFLVENLHQLACVLFLSIPLT